MISRPLRSGYTTGACAAAAAKGAALMLARQSHIDQVTIQLPGDIPATFQLHGQTFSSGEAACYVIKDAGDDPDITNGAELHARVTLGAALHPGEELPLVAIAGGIGIGRVTKPGLAVPPGQWAINPVPRAMIEQAVAEVLSPLPAPQSPVPILVTISIPDGEERARKTLNSRLGIIGGLSILGTTGIVRPISAKAWTDTLEAALGVARACECPTVVLSTGRTSELAVQKLLNEGTVQDGKSKAEPRTTNHEQRTLNCDPLPEEAFIMMGDHVAYALAACQRHGFHRPLIACQFAKLLKIACGHPNTHAAASDLDLAILRRWCAEEALPPPLQKILASAHTAREAAIASGYHPALVSLVIGRAQEAASRHAAGISASFLLCTYEGAVWDPTDPFADAH